MSCSVSKKNWLFASMYFCFWIANMYEISGVMCEAVTFYLTNDTLWYDLFIFLTAIVGRAFRGNRITVLILNIKKLFFWSV